MTFLYEDNFPFIVCDGLHIIVTNQFSLINITSDHVERQTILTYGEYILFVMQISSANGIYWFRSDKRKI